MDLWGGVVKQFSLFFDPTPTNDDKGEEGKVLSRLGREEKCAVYKLASLLCSLQVFSGLSQTAMELDSKLEARVLTPVLSHFSPLPKLKTAIFCIFEKLLNVTQSRGGTCLECC